MYALTRALYKKALGYECDNMRSVIPYRTDPTSGVQQSGGHSIIVKFVDNMALNTKDQAIINITNNTETLVSVGDLINGKFNDLSQGGDAWKNRKLLWIAVIDTATGHMRANIDLTTVRVDLFAKSELKLQNVTVPDATAVTEDNVNNVPLVGRSYSMKNWCPRVSDDDNSYLSIGIQNTGMITWRANQSSGQQFEAWKEPPPSKSFTNCIGSTSVRLEPGNIKVHASSTRKTMALEDYLLSMSYNYANANNKNVKVGTHDMFALERLVQLAGVLPIKLVYECNMFTGVSISFKRRAAIMQKVTFATQNSVP
jgi:hypothetical protein